MTSSDKHEKSLLKVAQFILFISNRKLCKKDINLIFCGLDVDSKVPETSFLKEHNYDLIGKTLLHLAYEKLNIKVFNLLIDKGANFNAKDKNGNTILHKIFHALGDFSDLDRWDIKREESISIATSMEFIVSTLSAHIEYKNTNNPSDTNGLTHFHIACATNNIKAVEFFLNNGVHIDQTVFKAISEEHFEGYTGLHFAAQFGHLQATEILLKHGANANLRDAIGKTPLHISLERHITMIDSTKKVCSRDILMNELIIDLLMNHAVDTGLSLVSVGCIVRNFNLSKNILSHASNINEAISKESRTWPGYTALHFAARTDVEKVKLLMKHGADIQAEDAKGNTLFNLCINKYKAKDISDILRLVPKWENIVLSDGKTKLADLLCAFKDVEGINELLKKSIDNIKLFVPFDSPVWPGFTILHLAVLLSERTKCKADYEENKKHLVFNPDLAIITEILKQGADVTIKDYLGWTPVHFAFRLDKSKTLDFLLKYHHKTKNPIDESNLSHLHVACATGNQDLVEKLLWNEADVNISYEGDSPISGVYSGWTPLHIAVHKADAEITKLLLKFRANVHALDNHGFTPIHLLQALPQDTVRMLLDASNLRDVVVEDSGLSYLHVACRNLNLDAAKRLLDLGADVNKVVTCSLNMFEGKSYDGCTPLQCALINCNSSSNPARLQLVSLLLERGADLLVNDPTKASSPLNAILTSNVDELLALLVAALMDNEDLRERVQRETGLTILHVACRRMHLDSIEDALNSGVDVNARIPDNSSLWPGCSPLHVLILSFHDFVGEDSSEFVVMLELLLDRRADVTLLDAKKRTPLHMAHHRLYAELDEESSTHVSLMLKAHKNFEVNPTSVEGISHFHIACHALDFDVAKSFLDHGHVDVNSRIDAFYNFDVAACSPLLLATRKTSWREIHSPRGLIESFAELKVVDLLIKHGALVNVEDLQGNTPAHHAALNSSPRKNLLLRLVNAGACVNARNVRGQQPLQLLLKKTTVTFEEIRYFLACGCRFNTFNTVTEEGYIALASSAVPRGDMQYLLHRTLVNYPDLMKNDVDGRTAIHNIVSVRGSEIEEAQYAKLFNILMTFGCDIDAQDKFGRTALHLAVQFRNESAVAALLLVGADVNITDGNGRTPFAYCCNCKFTDSAIHDQFCHIGLSKTFAVQVIKLQLCCLHLKKSNEQLMSEAFKKFNPDDLADHRENFLSDLQRIRILQIEPYEVYVGDFLSDTAAVIDYSLMSQDKREAIDTFFRAKEGYLQQQFKEAAGIVQLQYRQAVLRRKMINEARDSLSLLVKFRLPDICSRIVLRCMKNCELQNLIMSTSQQHNTSMDVD